MGRKAQRRPKTHTPVTRAPTLLQQRDENQPDPMEFQSACDGSESFILSDSDIRKADLTSMDEVISYDDLVWYVVSQNHLWLIRQFPVTFRGCTPYLLEQNFPSVTDMCSELSENGRRLTDEEIKMVSDRLKSSGPRAFLVKDLIEYIVSEDHDRLIRTFQPFVDCTPDLLQRNFPSVSARFRQMHQRCHILSRKQVQKLIDLMRSSGTECSL